MEIYSSRGDYNGKDDNKRKSRNLNEKKRRDQFNMLIHELSAVITSGRKMDKSTILNDAIDFLKKHNENTMRSRHNEIDESWKSPFLTNDQFTHLMLEAVDGFIIVFSSNSKIVYVSDNFTSLLGYAVEDATKLNLFTLICSDDHDRVSSVLFPIDNNHLHKDKQISFQCRCVKKVSDSNDGCNWELVQFTGFIRDVITEESESKCVNNTASTANFVFIGTGRLQTSLLLKEVTVSDNLKLEFCSHHNMEWKYIFLDQRASSIIGYSPFEILGTSGFDYYHVNDLDKLTLFHKTLKETGKGISGYYRFLTKGQQWIWLQTKCYITYYYRFSKSETIFCTHRVVSNLTDCKNVWKTESYPSKNLEKNIKKSCQKMNQMPEDISSNLKNYSKSSLPDISENEGYCIQSDVSSTSDILINREQTVPIYETYDDISLLEDMLTNSSSMSVNTAASQDFVDNSSLQTESALYTRSVLENSLQIRHEQLQQSILQRQEELRIVSEQLRMARYGLYQSLAASETNMDTQP